MQTPNGITLSPDGSILYVASFVPKKIWAYSLTPQPGGQLKTGAGRILASMDSGPEKGADGMTTDRAGNIYCAGPGAIWIWDPTGTLLDRIPVPTRPINCTFGDPDMRTLFITGFGGLYRVRMRISGRSPNPPFRAELQPTIPNRPATTIGDDVVAQLDQVYARYDSRAMLADIFSPSGLDPAESLDPTSLRPAIVVVHGGGWLNGDKTKFRALAIELARRGYVTMAIEIPACWGSSLSRSNPRLQCCRSIPASTCPATGSG